MWSVPASPGGPLGNTYPSHMTSEAAMKAYSLFSSWSIAQLSMAQLSICVLCDQCCGQIPLCWNCSLSQMSMAGTRKFASAHLQVEKSHFLWNTESSDSTTESILRVKTSLKSVEPWCIVGREHTLFSSLSSTRTCTGLFPCMQSDIYFAGHCISYCMDPMKYWFMAYEWLHICR